MINKSKLGLFRYWILERETVRAKRESGADRPWSHDPVFQKHHFCNVRREDDRGTKERRAVIKKANLSVDSLPVVYTASNLFNYAPSLSMFVRKWVEGSDEWIDGLKYWKKMSQKVFHVAYVVSTNGKSIDKIDYVADIINKVNPDKIPSTSCREAYEALMSIHGLGSFLCGQIIADLKNDRFLVGVPDWETFSVIGPGSKKGLDLLFDGGTTGKNYDARMRELRDHLPDDIEAMRIHNQDLQNCLCEFSKYHRYLNNEDGRRRYYP